MDHSARIKGFFHSVNARDRGEMGSYLAERAEFYFPKTRPLLGKERILKFFRILFRQYPKLHFETKLTINEGQNAAVHWTNKGTDRKGSDYENEGVTLLRFRDGRIDYMSDFFKDTGKF